MRNNLLDNLLNNNFLLHDHLLHHDHLLFDYPLYNHLFLDYPFMFDQNLHGNFNWGQYFLEYYYFLYDLYWYFNYYLLF
jgi:hypothetical protein